MRFRLAFYGIEARILGMMHRRNIIYLSILKEIARGMGGRVPDDYRGLVMLHAKDAADSMMQDEDRDKKDNLLRHPQA